LAGVPVGTLVERGLFGSRQVLDIGRSNAQQLLWVEGERFVEERFLLRRLLKPGMAVVDVGANIGYYALLFKQCCGPDARTICIEPSIENLPELKATIARNGLRNIVVHEVALGSDEGMIGLRSGINSGVDMAGSTYTVPLRRLDRLVDEKVDFIKIDVEGFEGQVLQGAEALIERYKPWIFLELHPDITQRFGFRCRAIVDNLRRWYSSIELYERPSVSSFADKVASRYLNRDIVRLVPDPEAYVDLHDERGKSAGTSHTYWAVCRP
jgi:FkbM family methyltransferase